MNSDEMAAILEDVSYKGWRFYLDPALLALRVQFTVPDAFEPDKQVLLSGRFWRLSKHMTKSEVVQTALAAVLFAEEHEARERFRYKGAAIFGPHFDVDALVDICEDKRLDVRATEPALSIFL